MRGAKRKRTKHYPFHRSSPSRLPRPSSSHSRASLSPLSRARQIPAAAAHPPHLRRPWLVLPISRRSSSSPSWDAGARCWRPGAALRRRRGGSSSPARAEAGRRRAADLDAAWGSQPVGLGRIESTGPKSFRS